MASFWRASFRNVCRFGSYGLFCHVGMPVMMQSVPGYSGTLVEARARRDRTYSDRKRQPQDRPCRGRGLVARVWRLAPAVMAAIRLHHDFDVLGDSPYRQRSAVAGGHRFVGRAHDADSRGLDPDRDWAEQMARVLEWLQVSEDELVVWDLELRDIFDVS